MIPEVRNDFDAEARAVGNSLGEVLCNGVNRHCKDQIAYGIAESLLRSHRTLQQSAILSIAKALLIYAEETKDFTDLRNEFVVKTINKHREAFRELSGAPFF